MLSSVIKSILGLFNWTPSRDGEPATAEQQGRSWTLGSKSKIPVPPEVEVYAIRFASTAPLESLPDVYWIVRGRKETVQGTILGSQIDPLTGPEFIRDFTTIAESRRECPVIVEVETTVSGQYILRIAPRKTGRIQYPNCYNKDPESLRKGALFFIGNNVSGYAERLSVRTPQTETGYLVANPIILPATVIYTFLFTTTTRVFSLTGCG